jgi:serine/threonine-protein phosphatase 5
MEPWCTLRAEANEFFRLKNYEDACRCYLSAIKKCPPSNTPELSNLYVSLSAAQLIRSQIPEAIQSATKAIELDGSNYTGYVRRATAYSESMALQEAFNDFQTAANMNPSEAYLRERLEAARRRLQMARGSQPEQPPVGQPPRLSSPVISFDRISVPIKVPLPGSGRRASLPASPPRVPESAARGGGTAAWAAQLMVDLTKDQRPPAHEFRDMVKKVTAMYRKMPNIVSVAVNGGINIVGDAHGQYQDLVAIFHALGAPSAKNPYLFNGDLVDRGSMGIEILTAVLAWKLADPASVYINRGNQFVLGGTRLRSCL